MSGSNNSIHGIGYLPFFDYSVIDISLQHDSQQLMFTAQITSLQFSVQMGSG